MQSILLISAMAVLAAGSNAPSNNEEHSTDWFQEAQWGVFTHYLYDTVAKDGPVSAERWNEAVDSFDVESAASRLAQMGAKYYIITLGQNSGFYCSPNETYDKYTGIKPSKCSKRDLIADLYEALSSKGIRLMVYLPSGAPDRDPRAMAALDWQPGKFPLWTYKDGKPKGEDPRLESFQRKWEGVIREWSKRWGPKVAGWWFDGCYYPDAMYRSDKAPNFKSFAAAARAGNPNSIVAFNPGVVVPIMTLTPVEDYTAGEINEPEKVECAGRWVGQAQFHMLSYLGPNWGQGPPRFTDDKVIEFTRKITAKGGVVTWDVPIQANGLIPQAFYDQLAALGKATRAEK
jgi:alpha-L-fucosidase